MHAPMSALQTQHTRAFFKVAFNGAAFLFALYSHICAIIN